MTCRPCLSTTNTQYIMNIMVGVQTLVLVGSILGSLGAKCCSAFGKNLHQDGMDGMGSGALKMGQKEVRNGNMAKGGRG